jgi:Ca-activated chloride channel family protein
MVMALAFIVAAILGPRWGTYLEKQKAYGVDIVVAVDVSRSMLAADVTPNRLERAKRELRQQLVERGVFQQGSRLALLAFAGTTSLKVPLTTDHLAFQKKLDALNVGSVPRGGTAIGEAIRSASDLLSKSPEHATKIIMVVTDGEDHEGGPVEAAETAKKEQNINVFCIGVGDTNRTAGAEVPGSQGGKPLLYDGQIVFSKLDVDGLRKISIAGGGAYASLDELPRLVTRIASMKKSELSVEERVRHKPQYQWFLAAGMILLAIETMLREIRSVAADEPSRVWQLEAA